MRALYIFAAVAGIYLPTSAVAQVPLETLRTCLAIEDQSKERLYCHDEKVAPAPKQVSAPAKKVEDCRFVKEEDERLNCFNKFVNPPPKKNTAQQDAPERRASALRAVSIGIYHRWRCNQKPIWQFTKRANKLSSTEQPCRGSYL